MSVMDHQSTLRVCDEKSALEGNGSSYGGTVREGELGVGAGRNPRVLRVHRSFLSSYEESEANSQSACTPVRPRSQP